MKNQNAKARNNTAARNNAPMIPAKLAASIQREAGAAGTPDGDAVSRFLYWCAAMPARVV